VVGHGNRGIAGLAPGRNLRTLLAALFWNLSALGERLADDDTILFHRSNRRRISKALSPPSPIGHPITINDRRLVFSMNWASVVYESYVIAYACRSIFFPCRLLHCVAGSDSAMTKHYGALPYF
jgi:hypothetical protein